MNPRRRVRWFIVYFEINGIREIRDSIITAITSSDIEINILVGSRRRIVSSEWEITEITIWIIIVVIITITINVEYNLFVDRRVIRIVDSYFIIIITIFELYEIIEISDTIVVWRETVSVTTVIGCHSIITRRGSLNPRRRVRWFIVYFEINGIREIRDSIITAITSSDIEINILVGSRRRIVSSEWEITEITIWIIIVVIIIVV